MIMDAAAFTDFLHERIPLVRAMQLRVLVADPHRVCIAAPLEPNLNLHGTAFGGSLAALGILTGWAALYRGLLAVNLADAALVVQRSELDYLKPARGELVAESQPPEAGWSAFIETLQRGGRAGIDVETCIRSRQVDVLRVSGRYVALPVKRRGDG